MEREFGVLDCREHASDWDMFVSALPYDLRDVHFTSAWARAHETDEQKGRLAYYVQDGAVTVLPFMLRAIDGYECFDMTSAGYGGPVTSSSLPAPDHGRNLELAMVDWRRDHGVVTEFYLLNPIFMSHQMLLVPAGNTLIPTREVYIVHLGDDDELEAGMRKTRRQSIAKASGSILMPLLGAGVFAGLYEDLMSRIGAAPRWRFHWSYFPRLQYELGTHCSMLGVMDAEGKVQAAACFTRGTVAAYYHLACTTAERRTGFADVALVAGMVAARSNGANWMHLGGGLGTPDDTLATYKRSFGGIARQAYSVRRIHDHAAYELLTKGRPSSEFFPPWRAAEAQTQ